MDQEEKRATAKAVVEQLRRSKEHSAKPAQSTPTTDEVAGAANLESPCGPLVDLSVDFGSEDPATDNQKPK